MALVMSNRWNGIIHPQAAILSITISVSNAGR
jgi:hypothetical protein